MLCKIKACLDILWDIANKNCQNSQTATCPRSFLSALTFRWNPYCHPPVFVWLLWTAISYPVFRVAAINICLQSLFFCATLRCIQENRYSKAECEATFRRYFQLNCSSITTSAIINTGENIASNFLCLFSPLTAVSLAAPQNASSTATNGAAK